MQLDMTVPEFEWDGVDVRGPDERGACIQLAARWAEMFSPIRGNDDRAAFLERFRAIHAFVDAVTRDVEPPSIDHLP